MKKDKFGYITSMKHNGCIIINTAHGWAVFDIDSKVRLGDAVMMEQAVKIANKQSGGSLKGGGKSVEQ